MINNLSKFNQMKRLIFFASLLMLSPIVYAGGVLTNTNQSVQFVRMLSRNASTGIDAVYFNPAGLTSLKDGWHFSLSSQTILQKKPVESNFPWLNDGYYEGIVNVPVFPTAFAVYKMDKWAFSLGIGPNAGGGSAVYDRGLPSFEIPLAKLGYGLQNVSPLLSAYQIPAATGYDADLSFEGKSVFWGIQLGATYAISDFISVYGGVRYLPSQNNYSGTINNIEITTSTGSFAADEYLAMASPVLTGTISTLNTASTGLQAAINAGLIQGSAPVTGQQLLAVLGGFGQTGLTNQQAVNFLTATSGSLTTIKNADVSDKEVDTEQTGNGYTPMIGINISPAENFNIAFKYEMKTTLNLTNNTRVDDMDLFPDGEVASNDIPAILGIGAGYKTRMVEAQLSYNMYFNKGVGWGPNTRDLSIWRTRDISQIRTREFEKNGMEIGLGTQFNVSRTFAFSVGGIYGDQGMADSYQSDFSYSNPHVSAGAGIE